MDPTMITTALSGLKTATDIAKTIKGIDASIEKAELKLKIAELIEAPADAKLSIVNIRELLDYKEAEGITKIITYEVPYYWVGRGYSKDGPYCQHC